MRRLAAFVVAVSAPVAALAEQAPLPPPPVVISASRAEVWAALTTVEGIVAVAGGQASVDLRPGGSIRHHADAKAEADAAGWTSRPVLAFVAPRLLVLGDAASTGTAIELEALDMLRTRVRIEHGDLAPGSKEEAVAEEDDRALVARLRARFPRMSDPVVAAFTPLAGVWEERAESESHVAARWTVSVQPGDQRHRTPSISLERRPADGTSPERWGFWRETDTGRWVGGLVDGGSWKVEPFGAGAIAWSDRWDECGGRSIYIQDRPRDDVVTVETILGCTGYGFRWTRVADAK